MQCPPGVKRWAAAVDFRGVNEWVSEEAFWVDEPAPSARRFAPTTTDAADRESTFGYRVVSLVLVCVLLFGLATLVGFAAQAYAVPPGPIRTVHTPGTLVAVALPLIPLFTTM